ncbi:hypothetical protein E3N88_38726 [Mikania micrantha]|uniref:CCHC-type domain-containing protein n=1 Tax=Mikania micrantha TaxID=192012 RepID=A0A5N6LUU7_9ASTR|nr:hypothetical protein E3N88_38726 [Mikania micrantha]
MVFKFIGSKHGIQVKLFTTWYSNQEIHFMLHKQRIQLVELNPVNKVNPKSRIVTVSVLYNLATRSGQKSYADKRRKPLEFQVGDRVVLKVSPCKGVVCFGKKGKLAPRYVGPFEIIECIGPVAYRLRLPDELSGVHDLFHVSNLKKCLADESLVIPIEEIQVDEQLHFIEEPFEIMDRKVKQLRRSRIPIVKTLDALITRYRHLLTEVRKYGIEYSEDEKIDCLADASPDKWNSLVLILRENLPGLTLVEFIQKLEEQEMKDKRKARRVNVTQDPSLYGGPVATPPAASAKIQTTFVSRTSESTQSSSVPTSSSSHCPVNEKKSESTPPPVQLNTTNLGKVTVEAVKDHMAILSCVVSAYDEQVAGRIGNANLTFEVYAQIDEDEMELIDTQWALASVIRRINRYEKKTGKKFTFDRNTKFGFNPKSTQCYNCCEHGHFARECKNPKKQGNLNPFKPKEDYQKKKHKSEESSSKALVSQADEGYDWGVKYDDLMGAFMASLEEESGKRKEKIDEMTEVHSDLYEMIDRLKEMNSQLTSDLRVCTEANKKLILKEKAFDKKIIDLSKENEDLKIKVLQNNHAVSMHLDSVQKLKVELSAAKAEAELNKAKLENYQNSAYVIDHFAAMQRSRDNSGVGFHSVPPPSSFVPRPQLEPDLEVDPISLKESGFDHESDFVDNDAPIIEDITDLEYPDDILRMIGHQKANSVEKKSPVFQKSKSEVKSVGNSVAKQKIVSKSNLKVKTTSTIKPIVFVESSTTQKGESSKVFQKPEKFSKKIDKKFVKVVDKVNQSGVGNKGKSKIYQKNDKIKATGLKKKILSPSVASKSLESSKGCDEKPKKVSSRKCYRCGKLGHVIAELFHLWRKRAYFC